MEIHNTAHYFLTIVIPAYNEEARLPASLHKIAHFLRTQPYRTEVIVVENGSKDDTNGVVERFIHQELQPNDPFCVRLLHSRKGKGVAVRTGMLAGQGDYLFFCDADFSMPVEEIQKFLPPAQPTKSYDIAIASREAPGAVRYNEPPYRHLMGRLFNLLVRLLAIPKIQDTQCGFKCFTRSAAQAIFPLQRSEGWGFDVETLYIARLKKMHMIEIPIDWYYQSDSRVKPIEATIDMVSELLRIRRHGRLGYYA